MLQAVLQGKSGRMQDEDKSDTSWREVFKISEDILTASVFERLAYLDAPLFWNILRETFGETLPPYKVATLTEIEFWPRWHLDDTEDKFVEPDVFLRFEVGDPSTKIDFILEAKLHEKGTDQGAEQWSKEWHGYKQQYGAEGINCILLAIGGLGANSLPLLTRLSNKVRMEVGAEDFQAHGASWNKLAQAIKNASQQGNQTSRILTDVMNALGLGGYRAIHDLSTVDPLGVKWSPNYCFANLKKESSV